MSQNQEPPVVHVTPYSTSKGQEEQAKEIRMTSMKNQTPAKYNEQQTLGKVPIVATRNRHIIFWIFGIGVVVAAIPAGLAFYYQPKCENGLNTDDCLPENSGSAAQARGDEKNETLSSTTVTDDATTSSLSNTTVATSTTTSGTVTSEESTTTVESTTASPSRDCSDIASKGSSRNGVYQIELNEKTVDVYCDLENDGGKWTVIQRRVNGTVDFFRGWVDYQQGFGDLLDEFWLGLDFIHNLTNSKRMELRIDIGDFEGRTAYAAYNNFSIEDGSKNYIIRHSGYSGDAGNSLYNHNNLPFSTKDKDNDISTGQHCADEYRGAWWFGKCLDSDLNGMYFWSPVINGKGINWRGFKEGEGKAYESLKRAQMKIRPYVN